MKVRISSVSSVNVIIEIDQEDAGDLLTELDAALSEQKDQLRWPTIRELESRLEAYEREEEEEEEQERDECCCDDGCICEAGAGRFCPDCGGVARKTLKKKMKIDWEEEEEEEDECDCVDGEGKFTAQVNHCTVCNGVRPPKRKDKKAKPRKEEELHCECEGGKKGTGRFCSTCGLTVVLKHKKAKPRKR